MCSGGSGQFHCAGPLLNASAMACEKAVAGFWRTFPHVEPALQESLVRMPSPRQSLHGVKWWLFWWLFILNSLTLFCNTLQGHTRVSCLNYTTLQLTALWYSFGKAHPESDVLPIERPPSRGRRQKRVARASDFSTLIRNGESVNRGCRPRFAKSLRESG